MNTCISTANPANWSSKSSSKEVYVCCIISINKQHLKLILSISIKAIKVNICTSKHSISHRFAFVFRYSSIVNRMGTTCKTRTISIARTPRTRTISKLELHCSKTRTMPLEKMTKFFYLVKTKNKKGKVLTRSCAVDAAWNISSKNILFLFFSTCSSNQNRKDH